MKLIQLHPPESLSVQLYEQIKYSILCGEIEPGSRLVERTICQNFNASRTPLREAYKLLEKESLIERIPQGGVKVSKIDIKDIEDVFGIREVLEPYAAKLACLNITVNELNELKKILYESKIIINSKEADPVNNISILWELNTRFHETIYSSTKNPQLVKMLNNLRNLVLRLRYLYLADDKTRNRFWEEHQEIVLLLENKAIRSLTSLVKKHVKYTAEMAIEAFKKINHESKIKQKNNIIDDS